MNIFSTSRILFQKETCGLFHNDVFEDKLSNVLRPSIYGMFSGDAALLVDVRTPKLVIHELSIGARRRDTRRQLQLPSRSLSLKPYAAQLVLHVRAS